MSNRRALAVVVSVLLVACTEGTGPAVDSEMPQAVVSADVLTPIKWQTADGPVRFTAPVGVLVSQSHDAGDYSVFASPTIPIPQLEQYEASFWAVKGLEGNLSIDYVDQGSAKPYVRFTVDPGALIELPDGELLQPGDSVLITATVDTIEMAVRFGPAGLQFGGPNPPKLKMWYSGANGDLNGDGVVDEADDEIERKRLAMWYQEVEGADWDRMRARQSPVEDWFMAKVRHFSGFAIAY